MNNVMTNGFCELNDDEMLMVDGGVNWAAVVLGVTGLVVIGAVIASTAVTAGAIVGVTITKAYATGAILGATASYTSIGCGVVLG